MKQLSIVLGGLFILTACTSTPGVRVVEQLGYKPSWATLSRTTYEDRGKMKFVGYFTAEGRRTSLSRHQWLGEQGKAMPLQSITNDFLEQSGVAEDVREESTKYILSTLRTQAPNIPGLQVVSNYYERVELQTSDGAMRTEIRGYSLAECPVAEYNQAKHDALERLKGDPKIKAELSSIMEKQRDRAISSTGTSN